MYISSEVVVHLRWLAVLEWDPGGVLDALLQKRVCMVVCMYVCMEPCIEVCRAVCREV